MKWIQQYSMMKGERRKAYYLAGRLFELSAAAVNPAEKQAGHLSV